MLDQIAVSESNVRGYVRLFPTVFDRACGSEVWDQSGRRFIDFFCGAGTLNYGHNNRRAKAALLDYIERDGIQHALDAATWAKGKFLQAFNEIILAPRGLDYRVQFTGPTGTNAVEAATKLARQATRRSHVVAFTHGYHGHTLGSLALTANSYYHSEYYGSHNNVTHLPYDGYCPGLDSSQLLEQMLADRSSGLPLPAAIILETVQGEGGVNVASDTWLRNVEATCRKHEIVLIVDEIQVGNGRTGTFFSFEPSGIDPDMVCLSKSLGGGLPISIVLIKPAWDVWKPGEHTGTFRGNNLAFVVATSLLDYWRDEELAQHIEQLQERVVSRLDGIRATYLAENFTVRGRGLIQGLDLGDGDLASGIIQTCFDSGLLLESSGARDEVLKIMPALTTPTDILEEGLDVLEQSIGKVCRGIDMSAEGAGLPLVGALPVGSEAHMGAWE